MFDIDLPSYEEMFAKCGSLAVETEYEVECFDAVADDSLIGTFREPNPKHGIAWASRSEVIEVDHDNRTAKVRIWY